MAVPESLEKLVEDGVIDEIQQRLMSGKEASVYVVSRRGEVLAAKVYKARDRRTFKATSSYTEGRNQTRNSRDKRAMDRRTSYGRELMEESWRDMEYRALFDAHRAGVRVPKPVLLYEDVLLMELLLDDQDVPAPRLADFDLDAEQAFAMLREVHNQVRLLLTTGRIHGDLSAFNILIAKDGPTIIDLPQVVDASGNQQARSILSRDLRNVVEHLARFDERLLRFVDCGDALFHHFVRGTLDQATEPREVRREQAGQGRRGRGEERADGSVGQARRGPPRGYRGNDPLAGYRGEPQGGSNGANERRDGQPQVNARAPQNDRGYRGPQQAPNDRGYRGPQQGPNDRGYRGPQQGPNDRGDRGQRPNDRGPQPNDRGQHPSDRGPQQGDRGQHPDRGQRSHLPDERSAQNDRGYRGQPQHPNDRGFRGPPPPSDRGYRGQPPNDRGPQHPRGPQQSNDRGRGAPQNDRGYRGPAQHPNDRAPQHSNRGARPSGVSPRADQHPPEVEVMRRRSGPTK